MTSDLEPAEQLALKVAIRQIEDGRAPSPNLATVCVIALARLTGTSAMDTSDRPLPDDDPAVTVGFRVDRLTGGHVTMSVFVGRTPGSRGRAGELTLRLDEFTELSWQALSDEPSPENPRLTLEGMLTLKPDGATLADIRRTLKGL